MEEEVKPHIVKETTPPHSPARPQVSAQAFHAKKNVDGRDEARP